MTEKPNITYFLGAGASHGTIPILNQMAAAMQNQIAILKSCNLDGYYKDIPNQNILNEFIENLEWLAKESTSHNTVDTLAKKLYLNQDRKKLEILKSTLSLFFILYQFHDGSNQNIKKKSNIHYRYISLVSAFLEKVQSDIELPDNVRFVTWNYDYQLELALESFNAKCRQYPNDNNSDFHNGYHVVHLNGIAGLFATGNNYQFIFDQISSCEIKKLLIEVLPLYYTSIRRIDSNFDLNRSFTYAWEKNDLANKAHAMAANIFRETDYLVVIGYSFPVFNREYDRELLKKLQRVKKIYYQDPFPDKDALALTFNLDVSKIHEVKKIDQFFLPFEF